VRFIDPSSSQPSHTPDSVLAGLDSDQRAAVTAPVGIVVVRAGAGSGKTTVLTRRIAWRALNESADIERTLAITFTRQAATEMRTRLAKFDLDGRPVIGTFHAVARRVMMQYLADRGKSAPVIVNNRSALVQQCMTADERKVSLFDVLAAIDWAHARIKNPANVIEALSTPDAISIPVPARRFAEIFTAYEQLKKKRGVIDLNDFMTAVVNDAARDPRLRESIRFQFRHISVDEAQDMNPLQYEFLKVLLPATPDLFLVGDPNQAIYGFNGADKNLFDSLPTLTGGAHVISLPSNYRCTPEIVNSAVAALAKDNQVADAVSRRPSGTPVRYERCADDAVERQFIVKSVLRAHSSERAWSDIAVLTRINSHADAIREELVRVGVPVRSSRRGGEWGRAVSAATECTGRDELNEFAADILDTGDYGKDTADYRVAKYVRDFLDNNRSGLVDGRSFGTWLSTSADVEESDGVEVLSFHAAKGREWSYVIIAGAEKGLLPFSRARTATAKSEEARLAYVAFTRAADDLMITWTDKRNNRSSGPSPLLPSLTTAVPVVDAPNEDFRRITRSTRSTKDPIVEAIDAWRRKHARTARIDPDGVINKRQMKALAFQKPTTVAEIAEIIDDSFAARFGEELLTVMGTAAE
jgi:DNA helicase-2/ATP-dependent DNA helicase PcrA